MEEKKSIFRKKSLDHISSPEQINEYIRMENRGAFAFLLSMLILLAGICAWGFFGQVDGVRPITFIFN